MALAANQEVDRYVDQELRAFGVTGSTHVYKGALVGLASGYARGWASGDLFVGVAYEEKNNTSATDGAVDVRVFTQGDFVLPLSSVAVTDIGSAVFASADDAITLTPGAQEAMVGRIVGVHATNQAIVRLRPFAEELAGT